MRFPLLFAVAFVSLQWQPESGGTRASLRGIHAVSDTAAWASGSGAAILLRTGGAWKPCAAPAGTEKLDYRGIWVWDTRRAKVMSSGPGEASRLYQTGDGCRDWKLLTRNKDANGFWDALVFVDAGRGFLLGDPVNGRFVVLETADGGVTWRRDESAALASDPSG